MIAIHRRALIRVRNSLWLRIAGLCAIAAASYVIMDTCGRLTVRLARTLL